MGITNRRAKRKYNAKSIKQSKIVPFACDDGACDDENTLSNVTDLIQKNVPDLIQNDIQLPISCIFQEDNHYIDKLYVQGLSLSNRIYKPYIKKPESDDMKAKIKQYIKMTWIDFIDKVEKNKGCVERYVQQNYIRKRHPPELYKGLSRFNGQNNSKFYGEVRFWGIYSKKQKQMCGDYLRREFDHKIKVWVQNYLMKKDNPRPIFDEDAIIFRNRWGRRVNITDIYPTNVYTKLDELLRFVRRDWPDATFCGIVIKYDRNGQVMSQ